MKKTRNLQLWEPERFFYSHASRDSDITSKVQEALFKINDNYQLYLAERRFVGRPLIEKLREEILNCNALLIGWTKNASKKSREIISFEMGMAYSLGLPIFILYFTNSEMPWFFDKLTDYISLKTNSSKEIEKAIHKIEPFSFLHPIELLIPKEPFYKSPAGRNQSENVNVVNDDGSIQINTGFNGIIHFLLINNRLKSEKNVRLIIKFPSQLDITLDPGSLEQAARVQRNEIFDMRQTPKRTVRMYWPSLPVEKFRFEIRIKMENLKKSQKEVIECFVSSENIVGWRHKKIPINLNLS